MYQMTRKTIVGTNASLGGPATTATIDSSNSPTNSIINNLNVNFKGKPSNPDEVDYETVKYQGLDDVTVVKPISREATQEEFKPADDLELYKFLVNAFHEIIVSDIKSMLFHEIIVSDIKSMLNIIDQSGLIILDANNLIGVIARTCGVTEDNVKIEIEDEAEGGCIAILRKVSPLKPVRKIKVNQGSGFMDFSLAWNDLYNKIQDEYCISLERVYESELLEKTFKK